MRNTALSAAHMVRNPVSPGGEDMVKVRLQGTKEDMEWLEEQLLQIPNQRVVGILYDVKTLMSKHVRQDKSEISRMAKIIRDELANEV